jgi:hypothetical protein
MRRRKLIVAAALAMLTLVVVGAFALWPQSSRITGENFDHIRKGMTRAEVEAILGPPGDYTTGPVNYDASPPLYFLSPAGSVAFWNSDMAYAHVLFDASDKVEEIFSHPGRRQEQGPLDNLLWRAKRQWQRWFPPK